jgi:photosynthetic reaction center cytochrome c subunit
MFLRIRFAVCCLFLFFACCAGIERFKIKAQEQKQVASQTPTAKPSPDDGFGNVQVLKGVRDLMPTMHFIRASLGVRCDYCHNTERGKYRLDDKPAKRRAREMIIMTRQINETTFNGRQVVTCNTCHRGSPKPVAVPQIATSFINTTRREPFEPPPPTFPSADDILARYEAATHASTMPPAHIRIEALRGKIIDGGTPSARMLPRAEKSVSEALVDGERGRTTLPLSNGQIYKVGSNGKRLWYIAPNGPQWIGSGDISLFERKINPLLVLRVRPSDYSSLSVTGIEKLDGADAYVVIAVRVEGSTEKLWFSKGDGLLVRRTYHHPTLLGPEPEQYDLSEYKRLGGIRIPTVINVSYLDDQHLGVLRRLIEVKLGVTVADSDFEPPP